MDQDARSTQNTPRTSSRAASHCCATRTTESCLRGELHTKWGCPCGEHTANIPRHSSISPGAVRDAIRRTACLPKVAITAELDGDYDAEAEAARRALSMQWSRLSSTRPLNSALLHVKDQVQRPKLVERHADYALVLQTCV